jgi:coenzyme F420 hydrogenase subunit beta
VGLPCHIHGLRKAEQINQKLKNKIILHLGLFCGNISTFKGVDFLFKKVGIKKDEIARFDFRSGGLPSNLLIVKKDNIVKKVPHKKAFSILKTFSPSYCRLCCDATNELSDISFGDAWLPQFIATNTATSIMICRSHLGKSLVDAAKFKKAVMLNDATAEDVLKSQTTLIYTRKRLANATQRLHRKSSFFEGASLQKPDMVDYALAVYQQLFNLYSSKLSTDVLVYIPSIIMRIQTMPIALWSFYWNHKRK